MIIHSCRISSCHISYINQLRPILYSLMQSIFQRLFHPQGGFSIPSSCSLPIDPGPCQGNFLRWHYDVHAQRCLPFNYGGCHGNGNRFRTLQECHATCSASVETTTTTQNDRVSIDAIAKNIRATQRPKNQGMMLCGLLCYVILPSFLILLFSFVLDLPHIHRALVFLLLSRYCFCQGHSQRNILRGV